MSVALETAEAEIARLENIVAIQQKQIERLIEARDIEKASVARLREGLSKVATNLGNGSAASPECSLEFLCDSVPQEVRLYCESLRDDLRAASLWINETVENCSVFRDPPKLTNL